MHSQQMFYKSSEKNLFQTVFAEAVKKTQQSDSGKTRNYSPLRPFHPRFVVSHRTNVVF